MERDLLMPATALATDMEVTLVNGMETMDTVAQDCGELTVERDLLMPATVLATDMEATLANGMETTDMVDQDCGEPTAERDLLMPATAMVVDMEDTEAAMEVMVEDMEVMVKDMEVMLEDMEVMVDTDTERRYSKFILQMQFSYLQNTKLPSSYHSPSDYLSSIQIQTLPCH